MQSSNICLLFILFVLAAKHASGSPHRVSRNNLSRRLYRNLYDFFRIEQVTSETGRKWIVAVAVSKLAHSRRFYVHVPSEDCHCG